MEERLQKILAKAGYGSRRASEELISLRRVKINGITAQLGAKADPAKDVISVDGTILPKTMPQNIYVALHKPRGVLSDTDPNDPRQTVFDLVPNFGHLFSVGRLDLDSEGLILLTNDGELANRLTHPRYGHEKEYRVLIGTHPEDEQLTIWRRGVVLPDGHRTAPAEINVETNAGDHTWLRVIMKEGRKRQIREVGSTIGLPVLRIMRMRIGTLVLGALKPREWRELNREEVQLLKTSVGKAANRIPSARRIERKPGQPVKPERRPAVAAERQKQSGRPSSRPPGRSSSKLRRPSAQTRRKPERH